VPSFPPSNCRTADLTNPNKKRFFLHFSLLSGPLVGVLFGIGASYATTSNTGSALGDSARAVGELALLAQQKAKDIDRKHNVQEWCTILAREAWENAKDLNQKHKILNKTKKFAMFSLESIQDFCARNRVIERGADATGRMSLWAVEQMDRVVSKIKGDDNQ
jgi:hypothetical protein